MVRGMVVMSIEELEKEIEELRQEVRRLFSELEHLREAMKGLVRGLFVQKEEQLRRHPLG